MTERATSPGRNLGVAIPMTAGTLFGLANFTAPMLLVPETHGAGMTPERVIA